MRSHDYGLSPSLDTKSTRAGTLSLPFFAAFLVPTMVPGPQRGLDKTYVEWTDDSGGKWTDIEKWLMQKQVGSRSLEMFRGEFPAWSQEEYLTHGWTSFPYINLFSFALALCVFKRWLFLYNDSLLLLSLSICCFVLWFLVKGLAMKSVFHFSSRVFSRLETLSLYHW